MKNIEKYHDELLNSGRDPSCYFTEHIMKEECHSKNSCAECGNALIKWLNEEYKEPIKLTQFEYDMLLITKECHPNLGKLEENLYYTNLQDKGYFKNVNLSMNAKEVLDKCEVIEE